MLSLNVLRGFIFGIVLSFSIVIVVWAIFSRIVFLAVVDFEMEAAVVPQHSDCLSLVAAVITIVFLLLTLILECCIRKVPTSLVPLELVRIGILWAIWVAAGASYYQDIIPLPKRTPKPSLCNITPSGRLGDFINCVETDIIPALSMAILTILFIWSLVIFILLAVEDSQSTSLVHRTDLTKRKDSRTTVDLKNDFVYPQRRHHSTSLVHRTELTKREDSPPTVDLDNDFVYSQQAPPTEQMVYWMPANGTPPVQPQPQVSGYWVSGPPSHLYPQGAAPNGLPQQHPQAQQGSFAQPSPSQSVTVSVGKAPPQ